MVEYFPCCSLEESPFARPERLFASGYLVLAIYMGIIMWVKMCTGICLGDVPFTQRTMIDRQNIAEYN